MKANRGFTILEMLTIVTILSVLGSVVFLSTQAGRAKGEDAKRLTDIDQMAVAARLFAEQTGAYMTCGSGTPVVPHIDSCMQTALSPYLAAISSDPTATMNYQFDSNGCAGLPVLYATVQSSSTANWLSLCGTNELRYARVLR